MKQLQGLATLVLLYCLLSAGCSALSPDQEILMDFKELQSSCSEYNEAFFSSWDPTSEEWEGVSFGEDGAVSALKASLKGLCGPLPTSFGKLQELTSLDLSGNAWNGSLPDSWSRLVQLTALIMSLQAYGVQQHIVDITGPLPASFSRLVNLRVLDVSYNRVSGTLPAQYSALQALTYLSFSNNKLTGTLPAQYSALKSLQDLTCDTNNLTGTLPSQYSALESLTKLRFDGNILTGMLPAQYSELTSLRLLTLNTNSLTRTLPAQYSLLTSLTSLRFDNNALNGTLPAQYSALKALTYLDFSINKLDGTLPAQYSALQYMHVMSFESNHLTGTLPVQYAALQGLGYLHCASNTLTGTLPAQYSALVALEYLSFSDNQLTSTLPAQYSTLKSLRRLSFGGNNLTGTLPAQYSALVALEYVSLARNPFAAQRVPMEWLNEASFWTQLYYLNMSSMQLTGTVPVIPPFLPFFNMSYNMLTGSISSIPDNAAYVNLAGNTLTGPIPAIKSTKLVYLDLGNNQLSQLPDVFEAPNITFFNAANNSLHGSIPDYRNHSLVYCDLRNNSLVGSIPQSWTMHNFNFLALAYNKLSEKLPAVWEGTVSVLLLQNNSIGGCLPDAWRYNDSVSILSLSNNMLACELPNDYSIFFKNVIGIYLDGNKFTGLIPVQWMNGFSNNKTNKTVLYLGSMWLESSDRSQQRSMLSSKNQYWRKDICLSGDLSARLQGLSNASIPDSVFRQLQSRLDAAMVPVQNSLKAFGSYYTFQLPPVTMQLSSHPQPSSKQICMNVRAHKIVAVQWTIVAVILLLMVLLYVLHTRFGLLSRLRPKRAVFLRLSERAPLLVSVFMSFLRLAGIAFYWFDVGTDLYVLRQVFHSDSPWAPWVLLAILLFHYVVGAGVLGWYFTIKRRFLLMGCVFLVPVMPLIDTMAAFMTAARHAGKQWTLAAVDWQAVFELRHALEFVLESIPMGVLQTAIYVAGNSPKSGVYLDDWTYLLSALGTCLQIIGMVALVLSRAAKEGKSPWEVLGDLLTLPSKPVSPQEDDQVHIGLQEL